MSTRTKTLGVAAAIAAIVVAIPTAVQAYAEPTTEPVEPSPATTSATAATTEATAAPTSTKVPDPQGPGCDDYRKQNPTGPASIESMALQTGSQAIANNPELSTFSGFISGKLNPDINIVSVLDGGPYVVFAPTNAAFEKLDPTTLEVLKVDPVVLLPVLFYHMVLGYLGPNDVQGTMPTQDGRTIVVSGKGGEVTVNDNRVVCAYTARGAYIYMIDEVLIPPTPAAEAGASTTPTSSTTETSSTETSSAATTSAATTSATTSAAPSTAASAAETTAAETATPTTTTAKPAA
ncbi:MAG: fasciclin domain-containing protein [Mycobacterium sp.]